MRGKLTQQWMTGEKGLYRWRGSLENGKRCTGGKSFTKCLTVYIFSSLIHILVYILRDGKCKSDHYCGQKNFKHRHTVPFITVHVGAVVNVTIKECYTAKRKVEQLHVMCIL
jgi:hypothetical protein